MEGTKRVCQYCGSENVVKDAWAAWDKEKKKWVLAEIFDEEFCIDCEEETTIIEKKDEKK